MSRKRRREAPQPAPAPQFEIVDGELEPPLPTVERLREPRRYAPPCNLCTRWRKLLNAGENRTVITKSASTHRYLRCEICGNTWVIAVNNYQHPLDDLPGKTEIASDAS